MAKSSQTLANRSFYRSQSMRETCDFATISDFGLISCPADVMI